MKIKSIAVAQCLLEATWLSERRGTTLMKLLKLIYIAHGYHLARTGKSLIGEPVVAGEYGPLVISLYREARHYRSAPLGQLMDSRIAHRALTAEEMAVIQEVVEMYGSHTAIAISAAMHQPSSPWSIARSSCRHQEYISDEVIKTHYERILQSASHSAL